MCNLLESRFLKIYIKRSFASLDIHFTSRRVGGKTSKKMTSMELVANVKIVERKSCHNRGFL